jgi:hypothetical protein
MIKTILNIIQMLLVLIRIATVLQTRRDGAAGTTIPVRAAEMLYNVSTEKESAMRKKLQQRKRV